MLSRFLSSICAALLLACSHVHLCAAAEDLALPVVNAHFEYAAKDASEEKRSLNEAVSFKTRARQVRANIERDLEVLDAFLEKSAAHLK